MRSGAPKQVQLIHTPQAVPVFRDEAERRAPEHEKPDERTVEVTGTLKFADARKTTNEIQIVAAGNVRWTEVF